MRHIVIAALILVPVHALAQEPAPPPDFEPPELLEFVPAEYPAEAKAAGLEGTVVLELLVAADGTTTEVKVVTPAGHGFDEAAVAAAKRFVWKPGRARGQPVAVRITYEYVFALEEAPPPEEPPPPPPGTISGVVLQRGTRKPLADVAVAALTPSGSEAVAETTTDAKGRFALTDLPGGKYVVVALLTDHRRGEFAEALEVGESLEVRYYLEPINYDPYQTTVEGAALREEVERRVIRVEEATKIPGTRGDALRAVENMPGVARPPMGVGFIVVRGSNPEDTTPYIAGHWVPLLYHFGGITSVVNSDLLSRIDYLPGNFSSRYGRAIGGVVNVDLRAPNRERMAGYVDADVIDAGFLLEGPVGRGSWAVAARRSYIDAVFSAVVPEGSGLDFTTAPRYWDYQALLDYPLAGGRLQVLGFGSDNKMTFVFGEPSELDPLLRGTTETSMLFHRVHATWKRRLSPRSDLTASVGTGYGAHDLSLGPLLGMHVNFWFQSARLEVSHTPMPGVRLYAGAETLFYPWNMNVSGPRMPAEGEVPSPPSAEEILHNEESSYELQPAVYVEADLDVGGGVTVTPGARADWYRIAGEFVVDPRLAARWTDDGTNTVRAGFGRYSEQPQLWETDRVFGNPELDPETAIHASIGYDRQVTAPLRVEATLFYKWLDDVIVRDDRLVVKPDGSLGTLAYSNDGLGRIYGAELLLRHDMTRRFFGWVSYSISRSERRDHPGDAYRPFMLDQTHILTLVASWKLPWKMEAGARFRYVTGNPQTPIIGSIYDADSDVYFPLPGETNSERMGAYHQFDVRVDKRFVFDTWMLALYLDVQNAYNRLNPEGYFYSYDFRQRTTVTGLPIIPSIGVKGEF